MLFFKYKNTRKIIIPEPKVQEPRYRYQSIRRKVFYNIRLRKRFAAPKCKYPQILNFRSPERGGNTAPTDLTPDAKFDHRPPNYTKLEFQKRRTKTKPFPKYTSKGGGEDPLTLGVRFRKAGPKANRLVTQKIKV